MMIMLENKPVTIPQAFIQDLLARVDIVDVVGRYVPLKKGGANLLGLCPFHNEKSPSFTVSPAKQFYHCFGCGANGDAIAFLTAHTGMSFVEAVRELAQQVGMTVPEQELPPRERERQAQARRQQATLAEVLEKAAGAYQKALKASPRAVAYLKGRGLTGRIAKAFGLGYAPEGWRFLANVFPDYGDARLVEAGLVIEHEDEGRGPDGQARRYDRFRDRIMFPIRNVKGECIGFGGRVLDKGEPKYLNSPETPVFSKGRELYGLYEARAAIRQHGHVLVTEGYMDVVALAQLGFANAVATLGTACTPEHVRKLFRFTDTVVFSFDGDAAGRRAARKALEAALPLATDTRTVKFLFLPPEHDPDSYVRAHGAEAFAECVRTAVPLSRFLLEAAAAECDLTTAEGRARMASQARPLWSALPDGAFKRQLLGELARSMAMEADELLGLWEGAVARPHGRTGAPGAEGAPAEAAAPRAHVAGWREAGPRRTEGRGRPGTWGRQAAARPPGRSRAGPTRADRAVALLLTHAEAWDRLSADDHAMLAQLPPPHGPIFAWLEAQLHEHGPLPWPALREALHGHAHEAFARTTVEQAALGADAAAELAELAGVIHLLRIDALGAEASRLAERAQQGDVAAYEEFKQLSARIRHLKSERPV
jgi:DNA primase